MKRILSVYGIAYLILLLFVLGLLYAYPKLELHLLLNSCHTRFQDVFFKHYSTLAEWPLYVLALLPVFWKKIKMTLFFALSELTGGGLLQILKHTFSFDRPICAFENSQQMILPVVEGVNLHHGNSFPSGHASTFFVFCTCCAIILAYHYRFRVRRARLGFWLQISLVMVALVVLAALGAYSRVYLSQHFLSDVCVGSIIGVVTPFLFFYFGREKILKLKMKDSETQDEKF